MVSFRFDWSGHWDYPLNKTYYPLGGGVNQTKYDSVSTLSGKAMNNIMNYLNIFISS